MRLNVREVARLFGVTEQTVYRWTREDELPAHEIEGQSRFHRADVLEWATARDITPPPEFFADEATSQDTSIAAALERGGIYLDVPAANREDAIAAIVTHLPISRADQQLVEEVLRARPDLGKTALGAGIAIPHVRYPIVLDVAQASVTICFLERPVTGLADATPVQTVFTLVTPLVATHLVMLSRLAFAVHEPIVRAALALRDPATIIAVVHALETRVGLGDVACSIPRA